MTLNTLNLGNNGTIVYILRSCRIFRINSTGRLPNLEVGQLLVGPGGDRVLSGRPVEAVALSHPRAPVT